MCMCVCACVHMCVHTQSCPTLCDLRLLCPQDFSGKNTGMGCQFLLQGIFPTQGSNPCLLRLLHWRQILYCWATWEAPYIEILDSIASQFFVFVQESLTAAHPRVLCLSFTTLMGDGSLLLVMRRVSKWLGKPPFPHFYSSSFWSSWIT